MKVAILDDCHDVSIFRKPAKSSEDLVDRLNGPHQTGLSGTTASQSSR